MPDVFTKAKRSEVMSRIRGRGNKDTELALARLLRANGISGWRFFRILTIPAILSQENGIAFAYFVYFAVQLCASASLR
jgi:DNA mismatch endonuclease (patch repair protein)